MIYQHGVTVDDQTSLPRLPGWVTSNRAEAIEDSAFFSGAALGYLDLATAHPAVPGNLLRARLALKAAETEMGHLGRPERAADLRDAAAFLQPGDLPGPAGEIYLCWQRAVERPVSVNTLHRALPGMEAGRIAQGLEAGQGAPVPRAAAVLHAAREGEAQAVSSAVLLADASLSQALGWTHVLPLLALGLKRADLRKSDEELRLACHRAILAAVAEAVREAADLARRAARLQEVAPKLRARGAQEAVALFLQRDAVAPAALTPLRSDRAARRLCDRLVGLGAVRELTGRDTFRLYGV